MQPESEMDRFREFTRKLRDERFGGTDSALAKAAGVHQSTIQRFLGGSGTRLPVLQGIARAAGCSMADMAQWRPGQPLPSEHLPEPSAQATSPAPPPAKSDVRPRVEAPVASHWFPDEVEQAFAEALQHPDAPRMVPGSAPQLIASKVAYRDRMTKLAPDLVVDFCVQLLRAARALDEAGQLGAPDDEATKGALMSEVYRRAAQRDKSPPARPGVVTSAEELTAKARRQMEEQGIVPSPAALERRRKADEALAKKGRS